MKKIIFSLLLIIMVTLSFTGCKKGESKVVSGSGEGFHGVLSVDVTVTGNKITAIEMTEFNDTEGVGDVAVKTLIENVVKKGTIDGVDTITGATYSTKGAIEAIKDALSKK